MISPISSLFGIVAASLSCPPIQPLLSHNKTLCPAKAARLAASSPAHPAPATRTFFAAALFSPSTSFIRYSLPTLGFTAQLASPYLRIPSIQPRHSARHNRISAISPFLAFSTISGSAIWALAMATKSAFPSIIILSATIGLLILPTVITGIETCFFTSWLKWTKAPWSSYIGAMLTCRLP